MGLAMVWGGAERGDQRGMLTEIVKTAISTKIRGLSEMLITQGEEIHESDVTNDCQAKLNQKPL